MEPRRSVTSWRTVIWTLVAVALLVLAAILLFPVLADQAWFRLVLIGALVLWTLINWIQAVRRRQWGMAVLYASIIVAWVFMLLNLIDSLSTP